MSGIRPAKSGEAGVVSTVELADLSGNASHDDQELARLGKIAVLKRNFGFLQMLGLVSSIMVTWEGTLILLNINLANGGFAGSVYAYIFVWLGVCFSCLTMGEMASMAPTAGGQYHWVAILAPERSRKVLSYIVGWVTVVGWAAGGLSSACYLTAQLIIGLAVMGNPSFTPKQWMYPLVFFAVLAMAFLVNMIHSRALARVQGVALVLHLLGFTAIMAALASLGAPKGDASTVFTSWQNTGGWPTQGVSFLVGAIGPAYTMLGADGPVHLSEEIVDPARNVPRSIAFGAFFNGLLGFSTLIVALFSIRDLDKALSNPTKYVFLAIFQDAFGTKGALVLGTVIVVLAMMATTSFAASSSRILWSFARDKGVPGWSWISRVQKRLQLPLWAILVVTVTAMALGAIGFGSSTAISDLISLTIDFLYPSYIIGNGLLMYRRLRGEIYPYDSAADLRNTVGAERLTWGPWHIPEPFGTIINALGLMYLVIMFVFSLWPIDINPVPSSMNWCSMMLGTIVTFAIVFYFIRGRKFYKGPIVEISSS